MHFLMANDAVTIFDMHRTGNITNKAGGNALRVCEKLTDMNERPIIKLQLTTTDKVFEILGWVSIITIWVLTITNYANLPGKIPIHYNGAGQAEALGEKTIF